MVGLEDGKFEGVGADADDVDAFLAGDGEAAGGDGEVGGSGGFLIDEAAVGCVDCDALGAVGDSDVAAVDIGYAAAVDCQISDACGFGGVPAVYDVATLDM